MRDSDLISLSGYVRLRRIDCERAAARADLEMALVAGELARRARVPGGRPRRESADRPIDEIICEEHAAASSNEERDDGELDPIDPRHKDNDEYGMMNDELFFLHHSSFRIHHFLLLTPRNRCSRSGSG